MHDFLLKKISNDNIEKELIEIGYDKSYVHKAKNKFQYMTLKIFGITPAQGNIIKQLALSCGTDCGTNKDVITGKIEKSDCILTGNFSQLSLIAKKLQLQPFGLKDLGKLIEEKITPKANVKTKIMGILNVTTNSFSDGGKYYKFEDAIEHLNQLIKDGADVIDIGAESTKPGTNGVSADKQLEHITPVLEYIKKNDIKIPISIDTRSAVVASECIKLGASIINDVSGFDYDKDMINVIAQNPEVKVVIQHSSSTPDNMQQHTDYKNLINDIYFSLENKVKLATSLGIKKENIIIDLGIGFGKTREQNFELLKRWREFQTIGCPVLIGLSRKSLLNMPQAPNDEKDLYTLALDSILINENVDYIRVHNVKIHKTLMDMIPDLL
ncbi:MAG: dihydropteroate synthase [Cyanobacteriota bacterium]|nr:dihydropteroate synthase [Cyanobacteriota bacterium]MDY6358128.1 dihydropteroate synthase [Cyanobacteriota bacterium]MDY6365000.1 dihydropteroate synthase [Cyanobacteriota bacterium]MDY6382309.1 dihydropteroate synthase [Cyanobacteriota bacterium]